jgi:hypothetical protein
MNQGALGALHLSAQSWKLLAAGLLFIGLTFLFRRTINRKSGSPSEMEPILPHDLSATILRLSRWRQEGRLTQEEHDRLLALCQEDAQKEGLKTHRSPLP